MCSAGKARSRSVVAKFARDSSEPSPGSVVKYVKNSVSFLSLCNDVVAVCLAVKKSFGLEGQKIFRLIVTNVLPLVTLSSVYTAVPFIIF